MTPDEIPQELIDLLSEDAGKEHSRDGKVAASLARILTRYDEIKLREAPAVARTEINNTSATTERAWSPTYRAHAAAFGFRSSQ